MGVAWKHSLDLVEKPGAVIADAARGHGVPCPSPARELQESLHFRLCRPDGEDKYPRALRILLPFALSGVLWGAIGAGVTSLLS